MKASLKHPKEQISLIIMDPFKGKNNDMIVDLCQRHFCQAVIGPQNLMNRFQPLDINVSKPVISFN